MLFQIAPPMHSARMQKAGRERAAFKDFRASGVEGAEGGLWGHTTSETSLSPSAFSCNPGEKARVLAPSLAGSQGGSWPLLSSELPPQQPRLSWNNVRLG